MTSPKVLLVTDLGLQLLERVLDSNIVPVTATSIEGLAEFPASIELVCACGTDSLFSSDTFMQELEKLISSHGRRVLLFTLPSREALSHSIRHKAVQNIEAMANRHPRVMDILTSDEFASYVDLDRIFDDRALYLAGSNYSFSFYEQTARFIHKYSAHLFGTAPRAIICDLDNTLWDGTLAEDHMDGSDYRALPESPEGKAFRDLQRELKRAADDGILLCIASRNSPEQVRSFFANNLNFPLQLTDFAFSAIGFDTKDKLVAAALAALSLSAKHVLFLDDNPHERSLVSAAFAGLRVPDFPSDPFLLPRWIRKEIGCIPKFHTREDALRKFSIESNSRRARIRDDNAFGIEEWLKNLGAEVYIEPLCQRNLPRAFQLLNRTNQFHISKRRPSQEDIWKLSQEKQTEIWLYGYRDRIADEGLVGITVSYMTTDRLEVRDFALSCRVLGRRIEYAVLRHLVSRGNQKPIYMINAEDGKLSAGSNFVKQTAEAAKKHPTSANENFVLINSSKATLAASIKLSYPIGDGC